MPPEFWMTARDYVLEDSHMHSVAGIANHDLAAARSIIETVQAEGRQFVMEPEAKQVLRAYGVPAPHGRFCRTTEEVLAAAREIGYPVALKIVSPKVVHKTEIGAVRVGITDDEALRRASSEMAEAVTAKVGAGEIRGLLVEEMARGHEVIIGGVKDPQFGPLIMFGLGGIFVEVLKDVSYRLAPVALAEAQKMVSEIKGHALLAGARGGRPVDEKALADILVKVSHLINDLPQIREIDLNPVFVDGDSIMVADARIILE